MIKEQDILEAIAECQGERNPNANTCRNLAAFYTILDHIRGDDAEPEIAPSEKREFSEKPMLNSGSEFSDAIKGKPMSEVLSVMDELMDAVMVTNPKLYRLTIQRFK